MQTEKVSVWKAVKLPVTLNLTLQLYDFGKLCKL